MDSNSKFSQKSGEKEKATANGKKNNESSSSSEGDDVSSVPSIGHPSQTHWGNDGINERGEMSYSMSCSTKPSPPKGKDDAAVADAEATKKTQPTVQPQPQTPKSGAKRSLSKGGAPRTPATQRKRHNPMADARASAGRSPAASGASDGVMNYETSEDENGDDENDGTVGASATGMAQLSTLLRAKKDLLTACDLAIAQLRSLEEGTAWMGAAGK